MTDVVGPSDIPHRFAFVAPPDGLFDKTLSNIEEVIARGGKVVMISDAGGIARLDGRCAFGIPVPQCAPFTEPVKSAVRGVTDPAEVLVFAAPEA